MGKHIQEMKNQKERYMHVVDTRKTSLISIHISNVICHEHITRGDTVQSRFWEELIGVLPGLDWQLAFYYGWQKALFI